jgi:hypothetical protein
MIDDQNIYAVIGEEGFHAPHRGVLSPGPGDDILAVMYPPQDLAGRRAAAA